MCLNSSTDATANELSDDTEDDSSVDDAIDAAGAEGGPKMKSMVAEESEKEEEAVEQFEKSQGKAAADSDNDDTATNILSNLQGENLVPQPNYHALPAPPQDGNYIELMLLADPDAPAQSAAGGYDARNSPFGGGGNPAGNYVPVNAALVRSNLQREANPPYNSFLQSRCCKLTAGLVGGAAVSGAMLAVLFTKVFNAGQTKQAVTPPVTPVAPIVPPPVPAELMAAAQSENSILLAWVASAAADDYVIKRDGVALTTNPRINSFTDTGLAAGNSYSYTVAARNAAGTSADSAPVSATTLTAPPPAPPVPSGLIGIALATDRIRFSWLAATGATSYTVKRKLVTDTNFAAIATVQNPGRLRMFYEDSGLVAATVYCYTVSATNADGTSADAEFLCINTQDALDVQAAQIVSDYNSLDESVYWNQIIAWLNVDHPSFDVQLNVAAYSYGIVDKSRPAVLNTPAAIEAEVTTILNAYKTGKDTLSIYRTLANLTAGRGVPVERYEKLNVLIRVLGLIIAPPGKRREDA